LFQLLVRKINFERKMESPNFYLFFNLTLAAKGLFANSILFLNLNDYNMLNGQYIVSSFSAAFGRKRKCQIFHPSFHFNFIYKCSEWKMSEEFFVLCKLTQNMFFFALYYKLYIYSNKCLTEILFEILLK
jgi:hypothetical protein